MTFGLVDVGYSLPEGQPVKLIFFAPCLTRQVLQMYVIPSIMGIWVLVPHGDEAQEATNNSGNNQVAQQPAQRTEVAGEAESPKEIAEKITRWLERKGVARSDFAKYINRSKSTFTNMLKRPPASLPKGCGKEAWLKMREFLQNETTRNAFLDSLGGKKRKRTTTDDPGDEPSVKDRPVKFQPWQLTMLDEIYLKYNGRPQSESIDYLSKTLKIGKDKVRI